MLLWLSTTILFQEADGRAGFRVAIQPGRESHQTIRPPFEVLQGLSSSERSFQELPWGRLALFAMLENFPQRRQSVQLRAICRDSAIRAAPAGAPYHQRQVQGSR